VYTTTVSPCRLQRIRKIMFPSVLRIRIRIRIRRIRMFLGLRNPYPADHSCRIAD
jgi:hypothetical protein